jgi:signal transduction histidine kinase
MRGTPEWVRDAWLPVLLTVLACAEVAWGELEVVVDRPALLSVMLPLALATWGRRRAPGWTAVAVGVLTGVLVLTALPSLAAQPPLLPFLVLLVTLFNLGLQRTRRRFATAAGAAVLTVLVWQAAGLAAGQPWGDVVPSTLFLVGALVVGTLLGSSRSHAVEQRVRAEDAERGLEAHASAAVAVERARMARELHDVIAHALTGIVVEAGVEARVDDGTGDARATLRSIEQRGREAMTELRRLLGLLREEGQGPPDAPLPSLGSAGSLVAAARRSGHAVALHVSGDVDTVPPALQLAAYRILQEALTNVTRHAPGASVVVTVERCGHLLTLRVVDDGARGAPVLAPGGMGLTGMHERARVFDGELVAGPTESGFAVEARLPVPAVGSGP